MLDLRSGWHGVGEYDKAFTEWGDTKAPRSCPQFF